MPLSQAIIAARVANQGKVYPGQFEDTIDDFIRDTCQEISTAVGFHWLEEVQQLTVPSTNTDWIDLDSRAHTVKTVGVASGTQLGKTFTYVKESDYALDYVNITNCSAGRYRIRWNVDELKFQIALIHPPDAGTILNLLVKKWLSTPEQFPDFMEECIVVGATARLLVFQEGDDLDYGNEMMAQFSRLTGQNKILGDNRLSDQPKRVKTQRELDSQLASRYQSPTIVSGY